MISFFPLVSSWLQELPLLGRVLDEERWSLQRKWWLAGFGPHPSRTEWWWFLNVLLFTSRSSTYLSVHVLQDISHYPPWQLKHERPTCWLLSVITAVFLSVSYHCDILHSRLVGVSYRPDNQTDKMNVYSSGEFCCGPCPVTAIKEGNLGVKYDATFVFAEVNADIIYWIVQGDGQRKKVIDFCFDWLHICSS